MTHSHRQKPIHIHFVCTGNAYRSRLAETYLKSKNVPYITVSSSGTRALEYQPENGPICWYAMRLASKHGISHHVKPVPHSTTKELLEAADIVIFMAQTHHDWAVEKHNFSGTSEVWHIPDLNEQGYTNDRGTIEEEIQMLKLTEETFAKICEKVDTLVAKIS